MAIPRVPTTSNSDAMHRQQLAEAVNRTIGGKIDCVLPVTLTPNATSTTLSDPRIWSGSHITLTPQTANAAAAQSGLFVTLAKGVATITHAASATADRTFSAGILG